MKIGINKRPRQIDNFGKCCMPKKHAENECKDKGI